MELQNNRATPKKETAKNTSASELKTTSVYDDDNIPEIYTQDLIPDEVPRRDGPGGE